jgi:hypothetical protein
MRLCRGQSDIRSVEDWFRIAPPKRGANHWKDGRSAKELARAWCGKHGHPYPPKEFLNLLAPLVTEDQLTNAVGWPEHQVPIDDLPGEPPNIDLAIVCDGLRGRTTICVEAKADEPFGEYASTVYDAALNRINRGIPTGSLRRLHNLEEMLFPEPIAGLPGRTKIRYQLLTGIAAALGMAKKQSAPVAVFVVHEFAFAGHVRGEKLLQNEIDLCRFLTRLTGGAIASAPRGVLLGPLSSPSPKIDWSGVSLYLGKAITKGTLPSS